MRKVNTLTLSKNMYKSEQDWRAAIGDAVRLLLNAGYVMVVRYDEPGLGIIVIEYESNCSHYGGPQPYWLEEEDIVQITIEEE